LSSLEKKKGERELYVQRAQGKDQEKKGGGTDLWWDESPEKKGAREKKTTPVWTGGKEKALRAGAQRFICMRAM